MKQNEQNTNKTTDLFEFVTNTTATSETDRVQWNLHDGEHNKPVGLEKGMVSNFVSDESEIGYYSFFTSIHYEYLKKNSPTQGKNE